MNKLLLLPLFFLTISASSQTAVDSFLTNYLSAHHIPGMSACIVKDGKLAWAKAYGLANVANNTPVTLNSIFMLASVSKTITGDALMNEWENGSFQLDDSINSVLPWNAHNPWHPNVPITYHQLLTHTSSIQDNWNVFNASWVLGDSPYTLPNFMHDYLVPGSVNYDSTLNFYHYQPGDSSNYCNAAIALCGYLVKQIAGFSFNQYCIDSIFTPLCMDNTSWFLSGIPDTTLIARPYLYQGGNYVDQGLYGFPDFPDGQLRTNVISLAKFLVMNMQYGRLGNVRVLDSATVNLMRTVQYPALDAGQGLIWYRYNWMGRTIWGHSGGYDGAGSEMWMDSVKNEGVILLCNRNASTFDPMLNELFLMADTINLNGKPVLDCNFTTTTSEIKTTTAELTLYPDPAENIITAEMQDNGLKMNGGIIEIKNVLGQTVKTEMMMKNGQLTIDIKDLQSGIYFLTIKNDSEIISKKFIKQ